MCVVILVMEYAPISFHLCHLPTIVLTVFGVLEFWNISSR